MAFQKLDAPGKCRRQLGCFSQPSRRNTLLLPLHSHRSRCEEGNAISRNCDKDSFSCNQLNQEWRSLAGTNGEQTMEKAVPSGKVRVFQVSAPWTPQAAPLGSFSSSISPFQIPHFMPHLPPWESRVDQDRPGLTLLQQNSGFAWENLPLHLCREQDRNTKYGISFMATS